MTDQPGPMPQRIGDADRDKAAEFLRDHLAEGRLDQDEFDDRLTRALTAKTQSDLDPLFTDLPGPRPGSTLVPADTFKAPPWQAGQVVPKPASQVPATSGASRAWATATALAWPAAIILCFATDWRFWWIMLIPIFISSGFGKMQQDQHKHRR